jgi:Fic family protein
VYIWQRPDWPQFRFDALALAPALSAVTHAQGHLLGRLADVGFAPQAHAMLNALSAEALKTSEIEGERFDALTVRSSVARKLGVDIAAVAPVDRRVEGLVEMVLDASRNFAQPLSNKRLFAWHGALFPTGFSGMTQLRVAKWRNDSQGPMQVISGPIGRRRVHFEAPPAAQLKAEMAAFLRWFNQADALPLVLKAGLAHLWFVTLHPFDDGNGRIARAVGDLALAKAEQSTQRFYSLSAQFQRERKDYYAILENTQKGSCDVTAWLAWFLGCLLHALAHAQHNVDEVLQKARFWQRFNEAKFNARQRKVLNRLLDGFDGKLSSSKYAAINKCSADTALRDLAALLELGALRKSAAGGRSTAYEIDEET